MKDSLEQAVAALGPGPLTEAALARHIFPLFSKSLASREIYLANHSLGRPLDRTSEDVQEALSLWQTKLGEAWGAWLDERESFRARIAALIGAKRRDCIVPKTSAGQGLRTVLNALPGKPVVLSTRGEFDSIDVVLKQYAALGRIDLLWVSPDADNNFSVESIVTAIDTNVDLVVVSQVTFMTGQVVHGLDRLASACHSTGTRLLVDGYHAVGVLPIDVNASGVDFVIGGCYKYLRGGPGAAFLYISPEVIDSGVASLDVGWFAKDPAFAYDRSDQARFAAGGDAFLEGTPPVLMYYQARAGLEFTLAMGVPRLREYGLERLGLLKRYLQDTGIDAVGGDADHGGFLTVRNPHAFELPGRLAAAGIRADARGEYLRLCPDCLTREDELRSAADSVARAVESAFPTRVVRGG